MTGREEKNTENPSCSSIVLPRSNTFVSTYSPLATHQCMPHLTARNWEMDSSYVSSRRERRNKDCLLEKYNLDPCLNGAYNLGL